MDESVVGVYFDDSQFDNAYQFDGSANMFVKISIDVVKEQRAYMTDVFAASIKCEKDKFVEDTYEKEDCVEEAGGEEEVSPLKVVDDEVECVLVFDGGIVITGVSDCVEKVSMVPSEKPPLYIDLNEEASIDDCAFISVIVHGGLSFDLNEQPPQISEAKEFDLNKLPAEGRWKCDDPTIEREFIMMLRLLLTDFH